MFKKAVPVFKANSEKEMNLYLGFYAYTGKTEKCTLRMSGASIYQVYINGNFVFSGPARAAHDLYRVDELDISGHLTEQNNAVTILLSAYQCNSFSLIDVPGFLTAEIENEEGVLAWPEAGNRGGIVCVEMPQRMQKVMRYSFQRNFTESYRLDESYNVFFTDPAASGHRVVDVVETEQKTYIPRDLFYPGFEAEFPCRVVASGRVLTEQSFEVVRHREHIPSDIYKCFGEDELELKISDELRAMAFTQGYDAGSDPANVELSEKTFADLAFPIELTGFLELTVEAREDAELYLTFDEVYNDNKVDPFRLNCLNGVSIFMKAGRYHLITAEPYCIQYLRMIAKKGSMKVVDLTLRRASFPAIEGRPVFANEGLARIYEAAIETFRQNTYDVYMDCPSRERAGWLCDSFFTSRTEYALTGKSQVERAFLSNFIDSCRYPDIDEGMLPMCYPSDHTDHVFIPNWALWFVLELEEYLERSGDRELVERAKDKVLRLMDFFKGYENEYGLLEKLPSWVFVEWSRSNDLVQDVNYPSNMLYARAKRSVAALYGETALLAEAEKIETYIRENTMVDGFFCDNSLRQADGTLALSGECTESCQYYAFHMNVATPESHPGLWHILTHDFGPDRKKNNPYPQIAFANSFIGNYLRLDLLARYELKARLEEEMSGYFLYMADKTGTLWENDTDAASCNHGFASYAAVLLQKIAE